MSETVKQKRFRAPKVESGELKVYWGRVDGDAPDVCIAHGGGAATRRHSRMLYYILAAKRIELVYGDDRIANGGMNYKFGETALEMLDAAGFDLTTLKISIQAKPSPTQAGQESRGSDG